MDEEQCKLILSVATEGFWDWDLVTDQAFLSPRYCELIGYPPGSVLDLASFLGTIHPEDRQRVREEVERRGIAYRRAPMPNDAPEVVEALAQRVLAP